MAVKFKNEHLNPDTIYGLKVTGNQIDTVGIIVWAGSLGFNLNQAIEGDQFVPVIPKGDTRSGEWRDAENVPVGDYVLVSPDEKFIWHASEEQLLSEGYVSEEVRMADIGGPNGGTVIAQVEIAIPGYPAMNGVIEYMEGEEVPRLDDVAINLHGMVNDLVMSIRNNEPTVDGVKKGKSDG